MSCTSDAEQRDRILQFQLYFSRLLLALGLLVLIARLTRADEPAAPTAEAIQKDERLAERDRHRDEVKRLRREGKTAEALAAAQKMLAINRQAFGELHQDTVDALETLADLHDARDEFAAARQARQEVLSLQTKLTGPEHWQTADAQRNLEYSARLEQLPHDQRRLLSRADHLMTRVSELSADGHLPDALRAVQEAREIRSNVLGADHWQTGSCIAWLGSIYSEMGEGEQSEAAYELAKANRKKCFGENHPDYATALDNLASAYSHRSAKADAELLRLEALEIRKKTVGEEHASYAASLHNLGFLYKELKNYSQAEACFQGSLKIKQRLTGEKDRSYAISLDGLANVYLETGDYSRAEGLSRKSMEIKKEVLGDKHPEFGLSLNNLAFIYDEVGDYARAEPLYRQALHTVSQALGETHPRTAMGLRNLANFYRRTGEYEKAETLYRQAADLLSQLGQQGRREYAHCLNELGNLYSDSADDVKATEYYQKSLEISRQVVGENHADFLVTSENLANTFANAHEFDRALPITRRVLATRKELFGVGNPQFQSTRDKLIAILSGAADAAQDRGDVDEARKLLREILDLQIEVYGQDHWKTADAQLDLSDADCWENLDGPQRARLRQADELMNEVFRLDGQKQPKEAIRLAEQALEIREAVFGPRNQLTWLSRFWFGYLLNEVGEYDRAENALNQALSDRRAILGEEHPGYASTLNSLAYLYAKRKQTDKAIAAHREVLALRKKLLGVKHRDYVASVGSLTAVLTDLANEQILREEFVAARQTCKELLQLTVDLRGEKHWQTISAQLSVFGVDELEKLDHEQRGRLAKATELHEKASDLYRRERANQALPLVKQAFEIRTQLLGEEHIFTIQSLGLLSLVYGNLNEFAQAVALRNREIELTKELYGENNPNYATALHCLGGLYSSMGNYAKAESLYRESLTIRKTVLGEGDPQYASGVNDLAINCGKLGDDSQEEFLLRQAVSLHKRAQGPQHPDYASSLANLAAMYDSRGDSMRAEALFKEAADIFRQTGGDNDMRYAWVLRSMATLYSGQRLHSKAEPLYRQALGIYAQAVGENTTVYAETLGCLGNLYFQTGDYARARPLLEESLQTTKAALGDQHPEYADILECLGWLHSDIGEYAKSEELFRQVLEIRRNTLGEKHHRYASALGSLARMYHRMRDFGRAEPLFRQALDIMRESRRDRHPTYSSLLDEMAGLYASMGDYQRALPLRRQAVEIARQVYGESDPDFAGRLGNLAVDYQNLNDFPKAEQLYRRALEIENKNGGENSSIYRTMLSNLGSLYCQNGDYAAAEPLYRRSLELGKQLYGDKHQLYALAVYHLGYLSYKKGDYTEAELLLNQAMDIYGQVFGSESPGCAKCLHELTQVYAKCSKFDQAAAIGRKALEIDRKHAEKTAAVQSERQQLIAGLEARRRVDMYLSVALRSRAGATAAYEQVLACKGAVSNRQSEIHRIHRVLQMDGNSESAKPFEELREATGKLAALASSSANTNKPGKLAQELEETSNEVERLEGLLAERSAAYREQRNLRRTTVADLQTALPVGTVLIDLLDYWNFDPDRPPAEQNDWQLGDGTQRRFIAFVTRSADAEVKAVDLGPTRAVDAAVKAWRKTFGRRIADGSDPGAELRRLLWEPLAKFCEGATLVLISPDGTLSCLPWAALPGKEPGVYLVEETSIALIPVPAQLPQIVAARAEAAAVHSLLLVGDVRFDGLPGMESGKALALSAPRDTRNGKLFKWAELPGTAAESEAIKKSFEGRFPGAAVTDLRQDEANEAMVRRAAPQAEFLHFATHGYFAPPQLRSLLAAVSRPSDYQMGTMFEQKDVAGFHPGLLSGLVLSGANRPVELDHDDGILTALEVQALDLSGVELATLSACETGLGETAASEGLLGLQRAFQTAGTRSVVAGLWKVPDRATQILMQRFYDNLWQKRMSKVAALREAQVWMLREGVKQVDMLRGLDVEETAPELENDRGLSPYFWAAFVLSGDWR